MMIPLIRKRTQPPGKSKTSQGPLVELGLHSHGEKRYQYVGLRPRPREGSTRSDHRR